MNPESSLRRHILTRGASVAVIGQGYVGLSLACAAAEEGFRVTGIDVDVSKIEDLTRGVLSVPGVLEGPYRSAMATGRISFTTQSAPIAQSDVIAICVPTPVRDHVPDLSYVEEASRAVAGRLSPGRRLVILESTTYPGTTDDLVRPILERSGLTAGRDFLLAYSPERIDPGNVEFDLRNTPRVVGGVTDESAAAAGLFYAQLVDKVMLVSSCRAAELAKLLENTFRHINIALVNELAMLCHETGTDVWEVVDAAATKPFGFMPFYPGPGVGGHCIPLDPAYLAWQVRRDAGRQFRVLEEAQDINAQMPAYTASRIGEALNEAGKPVKGSTILVLGVSYKPDLGDVRESPATQVITALIRRGAKVVFHDPHVPSLPITGGVMSGIELTADAVASADCVAILTPHRDFDLDWVADHAGLVFDARNAYGPDRRANVTPL